MNPRTLAEWAELYADLRGWAVFPLLPRRKEPATEHGLKDASSDPATVRELWRRQETCNIGLATGPRSRVWVLDVDGKAPPPEREGEPEGLTGPEALGLLESRWGPLPPTVCALTSGGGWHAYFRLPHGRDVRNRARLRVDGRRTGLDARGEGGYIVLPPSVHPSGELYRWAEGPQEPAEAPAWLLDLVAPVRPAPAEVAPLALVGEVADRYAAGTLRRACEAITGAGEGARHETIYREAAAVGELVGGGVISRSDAEAALVAAAMAAGKPEREARRTVADGLAKGEQSPRRPELREPERRADRRRSEGPIPPAGDWTDDPRPYRGKIDAADFVKATGGAPEALDALWETAEPMTWPTSEGMPDTEPEPTKPDPLGVPLREVLTEARAEWARRGSGEVKPVPLPPRWTRTAHALHGGLWPGCHILVGGTGAGKSQWAFEVAYNAAAVKGVPVAYVGLELDGAGLAARLAALGLRRRDIREAVTGRPVAAVPWSGLYLGKPDALGALEEHGADVLARLDAAPLYLVQGDARGWAYTEIARVAAALRERHPTGPALLVVDFLQLVAGKAARRGERPEELRERIGGAAYLARMAAREHGLTVLLLSATARSFYGLFKGGGRVDGDRAEKLGSGDPSRFIGTGKESGEVEYAADGVIALCRGEADKDGKPGPMWLAVAKSRTGTPAPEDSRDRRGWVCLDFDGTVFEEQDPPKKEEGEEDDTPKRTRGEPTIRELLTELLEARAAAGGEPRPAAVADRTPPKIRPRTT